MMRRVVGIDFGTSVSNIATVDENGNPKIIKNLMDASDDLDSAIYFNDLDADSIVGSCAKEYIKTDEDNVIQFFKRGIGKDQFPPYIIFGKEYKPVDLLAIILKNLKEIVIQQDKDIKDVIMTCPTYFGSKEKIEIKQACEKAGLNLLDLISEPTAAALSYCINEFQNNKTILVYDLGGGTFDVTILKMFMDTKIKIIATSGDELLGGKDWDERLYKKILNTVSQETGLDETEFDVNTLLEIYSKIEGIKQQLSDSTSAKLRLIINNQITKVEMTRKEFEDLTKDLVDKTMIYVDETIRKASQYLGESIHIDTVLLVGGSTLMPMIYSVVKERFGDIVIRENPTKAVAYGAAIYGNMLINTIYED